MWILDWILEQEKGSNRIPGEIPVRTVDYCFSNGGVGRRVGGGSEAHEKNLTIKSVFIAIYLSSQSSFYQLVR